MWVTEKYFLLPKLAIDWETASLGLAKTAEKSGTAPNFAVRRDGARWGCANTCAEGVVAGPVNIDRTRSKSPGFQVP